MANTTPITLKIPQRGFDELEQLATHASRLHEVLQIAYIVPLSESNEKVADAISKSLNIDLKSASLVLSGLASLRSLMDKMSAEEVLKAINLSAQSSGNSLWLLKNHKKFLEARDAIKDAISQITSDHPILARRKARELAYAHQNIFKTSRIITDLRPVFNKSADDISAMVLTHVLSIEYFDGSDIKNIEFALDDADVVDLLKSAERAQHKTKTTERRFEKANLPLIIPGSSRAQSSDISG